MHKERSAKLSAKYVVSDLARREKQTLKCEGGKLLSAKKEARSCACKRKTFMLNF